MSTEDMHDASNETAVIEDAMTVNFRSLTEEQQALLSKALFPSTHTDRVTFCGKERTLRPLTIKWSKQIHILLEPFHQSVASSGVREGETDLSKVQDEVDKSELDLLEMLTDVARVLVTFYKWAGVEEKIDEEDILQEELQDLVNCQLRLQRSNDFLLMGLRVLVGVMQQAEIQAVKLLSMFSGQS